MKALKREIANRALPQDAWEFWLDSDPSQPTSRGRTVVVLRRPAGRFALSGCRALGGLDQRQPGRRNAGLQKSFTVKGDIRGKFPAEISQVLFDGQAGIVAQQNLGRLGRFLGSSELR